MPSEGVHSVGIALSGIYRSRQALEISYGYRLSSADPTHGVFGRIVLTDYEADGVQMASLLSDNSFATRYAAASDDDVSYPTSAMAKARGVMCDALRELQVETGLPSVLPWVTDNNKTELLDMLENGENLDEDAPSSPFGSDSASDGGAKNVSSDRLSFFRSQVQQSEMDRAALRFSSG